MYSSGQHSYALLHQEKFRHRLDGLYLENSGYEVWKKVMLWHYGYIQKRLIAIITLVPQEHPGEPREQSEFNIIIS